MTVKWITASNGEFNITAALFAAIRSQVPESGFTSITFLASGAGFARALTRLLITLGAIRGFTAVTSCATLQGKKKEDEVFFIVVDAFFNARVIVPCTSKDFFLAKKNCRQFM